MLAFSVPPGYSACAIAMSRLHDVGFIRGYSKMAHDVFISYSHFDKYAADAACAALEAVGI
jgi:hypothetical protein